MGIKNLLSKTKMFLIKNAVYLNHTASRGDLSESGYKQRAGKSTRPTAHCGCQIERGNSMGRRKGTDATEINTTDSSRTGVSTTESSRTGISGIAINRTANDQILREKGNGLAQVAADAGRPDYSGGLLENLTVHVSHAFYRAGFYGWNAPEETPSFNRLYYLTEGEGMVTLNGVRYYPKAGQLMIMPAGTVQTRTTTRENPYSRYFCHFEARIGAWPLFHAAPNLYLCPVDEPERILSLFGEVLTLADRPGPFAAMRIKACLLELLAYCLEKGGYSDFMDHFMQTDERGKLAKVLEYIELHLSEPLEVETLAELVHLHPNYFIPYFKKHLGVTPMHYVQQKRIEQAKRLLSFSDAGISEIADRVGMELAHFSRSFKKAAGVSPSAYRNSTR